MKSILIECDIIRLLPPISRALPHPSVRDVKRRVVEELLAVGRDAEVGDLDVQRVLPLRVRLVHRRLATRELPALQRRLDRRPGDVLRGGEVRGMERRAFVFLWWASKQRGVKMVVMNH